MDCLASAMVGIKKKNTNDGTMLILDKDSNSADREFLSIIICNVSSISSKEGLKVHRLLHHQ
jgi:hypothetical protein